MTDLARLRRIINEKSYNTGGDFKLASGAASSFFFDMKPTVLDPEGANLVADAILERIKGLNATAIGGLVLGACPIASAVCVKSFGTSAPLQAFYVRKEAKTRGTQKMIEGGDLKKGDRVVVVEDVTTTGGSALQAVAELRKLGCEVVKVMTIVDREQGAAAAFAAEKIPFDALFTRRDFAEAA
ncbi:MAG: orotate phosphoribosyltransferase [Alphaproteobacteria bacterium]|nr:orotate phosphoribosyltransferase [Alphaproteobacteria bacterium]MDE2337281.1 orotate phosphoribosyltransferase [Alphaproteobacteria bacterium]